MINVCEVLINHNPCSRNPNMTGTADCRHRPKNWEIVHAKDQKVIGLEVMESGCAPFGEELAWLLGTKSVWQPN